MPRFLLKIIVGSSLLSTLLFSGMSDESWLALKKQYLLSKVISQDATIRFGLAMTYAYTGFIEEGFKEIATIPSLDPTFKTKVVDRYIRKTIINPTHWQHHWYLAFAYYINEQKDDAILEFQKVADLANDVAIKGWAFGYIAYIYGERKDWPKAMIAINTATKYEPEGAALYFAKGIALKETGDTVGAAGAIVMAGVLQAKQMTGKRSLSKLKNDQ